MRLMMLYADDREPGFLRPLRGRVVGMQVANNGLGLEAVEAAQIINCAFERQTSFERFEIANMLADKNVIAHTDRDGVLEMTSYGQNRLDGM